MAHVVTDEEFYEHYGDWYELSAERDTLVAMLSLAASRFRAGGFSEPVDVIELGWNLEGHFLNVSFISNPDYKCYGQGPYDDGLCRKGKAVAHNSLFQVPSWAFLFAQTSPNLPAGPLLRVLDHDRTELVGAAIHDAVGRNLLRVAIESRENVFAGIFFTDPHWLIVYFNDDGGEGHLARVSRNGVVVYPPEQVPPLSREWFEEHSKL